jgi:hypothetical protein
MYASLKAIVKEGGSTHPNAVERLSGFHYDVKHIATYAPYCDAFVVDRPMASRLSPFVNAAPHVFQS